jgi:mono/diheme cytochrome c family protein
VIWRSGILAIALAGAGSTQNSGRTVWDGVYTSAQAARGEATFNRSCLACHRNGLQGSRFLERWREDTLASLFDFMRTKMPVDSPGSSSEDEYLDIIAYVLASNHFPDGAQELRASAAAGIQVVGKDGPAPLPSGALVRVVGCLAKGPGDEWTLSKASALARTRDPEKSTGAELKASQGQALGTSAFRLPEIEFSHPESEQGHKVETKGYLDRASEVDRVLVTSLESLASSCPD